jgi:hypothetical protein
MGIIVIDRHLEHKYSHTQTHTLSLGDQLFALVRLMIQYVPQCASADTLRNTICLRVDKCQTHAMSNALYHACMRKVTVYNATLMYTNICDISIKHFTTFYHMYMYLEVFFNECLVIFIDILELLLTHVTNFKTMVL